MNKILITTDYFGFGIDKENEYTERFRAGGVEPYFMTLEEAWDNLDQYDVVVLGVEKANKAFFDQAVNLKVAMKFGVGLDNFDVEYAKSKNVTVANLPGVNSDSVAEMVLGLMLAVSRKIAETNGCYKNGKMVKVLGDSVINKTIGIVGAGDIGRSVMKIVKGLNMKILAFDMFQNDEAVELGAEYVSLERLFTESDFISLHIPLSEKTYHFIGEKELSRMKSNAVVINTARGGIVDEAALAKAVREKIIAGAGIDVFESKEVNPLFLDIPSIVCTPHISALTGETLRKMEHLVIEKTTELLGA